MLENPLILEHFSKENSLGLAGLLSNHRRSSQVCDVIQHSTLDENMAPQGSFNNDDLRIHGGPITRARAKKMKEALTFLIEGIWREQAKEEVQDKLLVSQVELKCVNMICTSPIQVQETALSKAYTLPAAVPRLCDTILALRTTFRVPFAF